jgi:GNAT superfamily N-acetyltransferase
MKIYVYEKGQRDKEFYNYIGPFALNHRLSVEMHDKQYGSIYDEPFAIWFIATSDNGQLLGFCTLFEKEKELLFDNCYVLEQYRNNGIGQFLFTSRLNLAKNIQKGRKIKGITKNEIQLNIYLKNGFRIASKRGKYYWLVLEDSK